MRTGETLEETKAASLWKYWKAKFCATESRWNDHIPPHLFNISLKAVLFLLISIHQKTRIDNVMFSATFLHFGKLLLGILWGQNAPTFGK